MRFCVVCDIVPLSSLAIRIQQAAPNKKARPRQPSGARDELQPVVPPSLSHTPLNKKPRRDVRGACQASDGASFTLAGTRQLTLLDARRPGNGGVSGQDYSRAASATPFALATPRPIRRLRSYRPLSPALQPGRLSERRFDAYSSGSSSLSCSVW